MTATTGHSASIVDLAIARRARGTDAPRGVRRVGTPIPVGEAIVDVRRTPELPPVPPAPDLSALGRKAAPGVPRPAIPDALRRLVPGRKSAVHVLSLAAVWLAVFAGAFVATEPAPVDVLTMGVIVLLPAVGLTTIALPQVAYLVLWLVCMAAGVVAAGEAELEPARAGIHLAVSIYLAIASFVFAAFVARRPEAHARLIFNAYVWAGLVAAALGIAGYLGVTPDGLFTVHQRAAGFFKDPNVYSAFLIPPILYLLHELLNGRPLKAAASLLGVALMGLALLMSFSRGAWFALAVALAVYGWIAIVTARTDRQRVKIMLLGTAALAVVVVLVGAALQIDAVAKLFDQRASLDQSYDVGPEGRFGGQLKAIEYILASPLGIGALQFGGILHHEQPHNVYLAMFLYTGWAGGAIYLLLVGVTLVWGLRAVLRRRWPSRTLLVAYAAFVGFAVEGFVIDTDHWRHFYLIMGLLWGQMFMVEAPRRAARIVAVLPALPVPAAAAAVALPVPVGLRLDDALARLSGSTPARGGRILAAAPAVPRAIIVPRSQRGRRRRAPTREARIVN